MRSRLSAQLKRSMPCCWRSQCSRPPVAQVASGRPDGSAVPPPDSWPVTRSSATCDGKHATLVGNVQFNVPLACNGWLRRALSCRPLPRPPAASAPLTRLAKGQVIDEGGLL